MHSEEFDLREFELEGVWKEAVSRAVQVVSDSAVSSLRAHVRRPLDYLQFAEANSSSAELVQAAAARVRTDGIEWGGGVCREGGQDRKCKS